MIYRVSNVSKPGIPLKVYASLDSFKIYACDCGLLRRLARVKAETIVNKNSGFTEFKGALAENAILQSLIVELDDENQFYWTSEGRAEIEFIIGLGSEIIPIEVKAEDNIAGKSLSVYASKYKPSIRIRFSMNNLQENEGLFSIPNPMADWAIGLITKSVENKK